MERWSKADQAAVIAHRHDFRIPEGLSRDQQYAWLAKQLGRTPPRGVMTRHFRLELLCAWFGAYRFDGRRGPRKCSNKTRGERSAVIFRAFDTLHELGYRIEDPMNLSQKHMEALVEHWADVEKLAPKTFQCYRSAMNVFCGWLGKRDVVKPTKAYAKEGRELKCAAVATRDKSWDGNGIDVSALIEKVFQDSPVCGAQLLAMQAFGLRPKEALMLRPLTCIHETEVHIVAGSKNGRSRVIPIETEEQRKAGEWLKLFVKDRGIDYLGWHGKSLAQAYNRMSNTFRHKHGITLAKLDVTPYGLRHQFVHHILARHGIVVPVKGGTSGQVTEEELDFAMRKASQALGHARPQITGAYSGSFMRPVSVPTKSYGVNVQQRFTLAKFGTPTNEHLGDGHGDD